MGLNIIDANTGKFVELSVNREIADDAAISGQKTVAAAGTAEVLGSATITGALAIKALTTNTDLVYIGNDGSDDVSSSNGYPLDAGDVHIFEYISALSVLYVDSAVNGEGVAWIALDA
jgi:hypothetical protein